MTHDKNQNKGYYKVEPWRGVVSNGKDWVAMISHDSTGTQYFYGDEKECWDYIDRKRSEWHSVGMELVRQSSLV